jgi:excisionase family DNA binding protein
MRERALIELDHMRRTDGPGVEKGGQMPTNTLEEKRRALSPREAERTLGISHATLYRLIKDGKLKTIKLGSRRLIPIDAIDALLAGGAQ